ncbi:MAG TPA: signal peptidase I, partial [Thermoanaerobaculia bacterium]|nr:signal peptidase I [Thermoanaerobaculia bacterium]
IVNKFIYGPDANPGGLMPLRDVQRGDIVVFRYPQQPDIDFVKRVVGLPGETVSIEDKKVFVDGTELREPYVLWDDERIYPASEFLPEPQRSRDQMKPLKLPAGQYFVMGDNRDHSNDSRYWGTVPRSMIKGRAFMVYWSFDWEPLPPKSTFTDRSRELVNVTRHFFSHTRWKRTFFIVDSQHHYTPGVSSYGNE